GRERRVTQTRACGARGRIRSREARPMSSRHARTAASIALTITLIGTLIAAATARAQATVGRYQEFGDVRGFVNVVGPGQDGSLNATEAVQAQGGTYPPYVRDQLDMY